MKVYYYSGSPDWAMNCCEKVAEEPIPFGNYDTLHSLLTFIKKKIIFSAITCEHFYVFLSVFGKCFSK